jgi:starvation-inducible DNA-binding protein
MPNEFTLPGLELSAGHKVAATLQERLLGLIDLSLVLKHAHWNVLGPTFIGVHEMLDTQVAGVRLMSDAVAERIAQLGVAPNGLPGNLVAKRHWDDYSQTRASVLQHLAALDLVYTGVIEEHRSAIAEFEDEPVTQDMMIEQTQQLEQYQWFVRAHLQGPDGQLATAAEVDEQSAASRAAQLDGQGRRDGAATPRSPARTRKAPSRSRS